jgi:hypothetical protein
MIDVETSATIIEVQETSSVVDVLVSSSQIVEVEIPDVVIEVNEVQTEIIEVQTIGPQGPPGQPGPPGGFEIVPITISAIDTWYPVPLAIITQVVDVVVYDQLNRQKVEIDVRINIDQSVDVKSKLLKTYNVHVSGI